jgi:hypothetical protein
MDEDAEEDGPGSRPIILRIQGRGRRGGEGAGGEDQSPDL